MLFSAQTSIRQKLMRLTVVSAGIALLFASIAFVSYEVFAYRRTMLREIQLIADMVETSSLAALAFEDAQQAEAALKTVQSNPDIVSAFLFTEKGHLLAGYQRNDTPPVPIPSDPGRDRMSLKGGNFLMVRTLHLKDRRIGTLYLTAQMSGLLRQFAWTAAVVLAIACVSFALAIAVFKRLQKVIERPMEQLAETARAVSRNHNYGLRVRPEGIDELGLLMADFNEMLAEIEHRDEELNHYREHLEAMVQARTEQLERDMTERKQLEKQLFRAQRLDSLGTLAGGVAHDLNNVLSPILLSVETLRKLCPDPKGQRMLSILEGAAQRGRDIVKQILTFARGSDGERTLIDIRHTVRETLSIIQQTFPKSVAVNCEMAQEVWPILGDSTQIHQLILNLCLNARDAMSGGGTLTLRVQGQTLDENYVRLHLDAKVGHYVLISVEDSGHGMTTETLERIFEPFFTTKEVGKGTGLGLSTVHAIIRGHGGFVTCYSEVGRGTTFNIFLPAAEHLDSRVLASIDDPLPQGQGQLVLVVDDENFIREATCQTLESFGYRVQTAADGQEALELYASLGEEVAVVLTDMMMPNLDGTLTIQGLRRLNPTLRIIAASGIHRAPNPEGNPAFEPNAFLAKPFTANTLLKTLHQVLRP
ncbi:MAG: multi-sensor hybrid histidine kinase [Holophagaceae bacterium]|nr:multi-sensor hybrid histidine kinase [Holophagaceae bacterium]